MMDKKDDTKSTLQRYYTLAHAMTPRKNSPTHGKSAESGDETDRSIDNEITESFFMDEINPNTESCSLDSSRENLLDGENAKESKPSSRPNSRPNSARRAPHKGSELPTDQRIKILEEGLKEADIEREVVLSCLGKEYLERIAMQNYLQEICSKSGLSYEETVSSIFTQTGAKHILENIMERRAKDFFNVKGKSTDQLAATQASVANRPSRDNLCTDKNVGNNLIEKGKATSIERSQEKQMKEFLTHFSGAESTKVNSGMRRCQDIFESSHTQYTKDLPKLNGGTLEDTAGTKDISWDRSKRYMNEDKEHIVSSNQSPEDNSRYPWEPNKIISSGIHARSVSQNNALKVEKPVFRTKQNHDAMTFQGNCKQAKLIMPGKTGHDVTQDSDSSILRSLELKGLEAPEKSIDSIDEGIFMLKSFLHGLQNGKQNLSTVVDGIGDGNWRKNSFDSLNGNNGPRRKLSLNESGAERVQPDSKPQRRRSYAEGMSMNKRITSDSQTMAKSRLFKPTVASRNKVKEKGPRREFDSDTESGKQSKERRSAPLKRSNSDVRHGPKRHVYNSYTSAEDDSSIDGEDRDYSAGSNVFHHVYQVQPEINEREYTKLMSILNMLHEQKMRWDSESRELNEKLGLERKLRSDLNHDNGVLRKSLEAANRAIKEINSNVQELKLTIVPLREENSKLRDQNQGLKTKLNLLRKDKAMLFQELQELKSRKQRYEEKLRMLGELYKNDRLMLVTDSNNNSCSDDELPKGGLSELLLTDGVLSEDGSMPATRKLGRNRDFSKRHSFHGFEKIEELAGDAEELLAEKEKLEQENQNLKKELSEIRQKIETNDKTEPEKDDDIMNRRRGWRMQREESKQRIIRDILKTESSQVYGRPYASCTNLTLQGEKGDDNSKTVSHVAVDRGSIDEQDMGSEAPNVPYQGEISFDRDITNSKDEERWISWKKDSERIRKRLQNCNFEKPIVKEEVIAKREEAITSRDPIKSNKEREPWKAGSDYALGYKAVEKLIGAPSKNAEELENSKSGKKHWGGRNNGLKNLSTNASLKHIKTEIDFKTEEKESKPKDIDSFASPQWPTIREQIKAIYEQPIEILEQSLYERKTVGKYKGGMEEEKSRQGHKATSNNQQTEHLGDSSVLNGKEFQYDEVDLKESKARDLVYDEKALKTQGAVMEKRFGVSREGLRMSRDNWQRKSTSEEITSYEDYRRKLRREELEIVYLKSNTTKEVNQPFDQIGMVQKNRLSYNGKERNCDGEREGNNTDSTIMSTNGESLEHSGIDQKGTDLLDGMQWGQRDDSPWVQVPVYLRNMKDPQHHQISTPLRNTQECFQSGIVVQEETKCRTKGDREIESVIRDLGSAFSNRKGSTEEKELGNSSKSRNHDFIRQSSGTVLYLDEIADSDSGSSSEASLKMSRRRSKSFRKPRPKSEVISSNSYSVEGENGGDFRRNRSLRLPKKNKDDFFSVDIFFDGESQDDSAIQMRSQFFNSSRNGVEQQDQGHCQHHSMHQTDSHQQNMSKKQRAFTESGTNAIRSPPRRPKSPGRFSCEMCRELSKKKSAQDRYCWEKYFPIGETTIETRVIKEDYV